MTGKEREMKTSEKKLTKPPLGKEMREAELKWYGRVMRGERSDPVKLAGDGEEDKA